jgi:hypothetical protein
MDRQKETPAVDDESWPDRSWNNLTQLMTPPPGTRSGPKGVWHILAEPPWGWSKKQSGNGDVRAVGPSRPRVRCWRAAG